MKGDKVRSTRVGRRAEKGCLAGMTEATEAGKLAGTEARRPEETAEGRPEETAEGKPEETAEERLEETAEERLEETGKGRLPAVVSNKHDGLTNRGSSGGLRSRLGGTLREGGA